MPMQVLYGLKYAPEPSFSGHSFRHTLLFQFELAVSYRVGTVPLALVQLLARLFRWGFSSQQWTVGSVLPASTLARLYTIFSSTGELGNAS